jgi:probable HAF family extracellular repeat protein
MSRLAAAFVFNMSLALASSAMGQQASFTALPFLDGYILSHAMSISADGSTVVGYTEGSGTQQAFRWTLTGGTQGLGLWNGGTTFATAVSGDGSAIVGWGHPNAVTGLVRAWRWTAESGHYTDLGDIPGQSGTTTSADAISYDGSIVAGSSFINHDVPQAGFVTFSWTAAGGMQDLDDLPLGLLESHARGMSADGSVIVGRATPEFGHVAYRWTASSGMVSLGDLPGGETLSEANAVSGDGSIVVGIATVTGNDNLAFRWTAGAGMVSLGDLAGGIIGSAAFDVSDDGGTIVGYGNSTLGREAFVWNPNHGMRSLRSLLLANGLNVGGWNLREATGVSADGLTITGWGINPDGLTQAWVATVPGPSALSLMLLVFGRRRRRN